MIVETRAWVAVGCLLFAGASLGSSAEETACACADARATNGWCDTCDIGYVADVAIRSRYLWETLDAHGHKLNLDNLGCARCTSAVASDGFCPDSRIGFLDGEAYFSRLTWLLAKSERQKPSTLDCATCRQNPQGAGWCERHSVGRVGRWTLRDREEFDALVQDLRILRKANDAAERCEHCAAAIVTNTECPFCRIRYSGGERVEP